MNRFLPLLAGASCATLASAADVVPDGNHLVVTATRTPTPIDEVLAPVIVIDRDAIERSTASDVTELLRFHAGIDLGRNGGPGQTSSLFIRGAESNHTLVMVDGVRINPGTIGVAALQNILPGMVERIEVVKGPRSALYGTDAIGGVINVITRRGARDGWSAEVGYGDYETFHAGLNGGVATERLEFDLGVSYLESAGFPTRTTDDVDRGYDNLSATAQVRAEVGTAEVALRHWRAAGTMEYSDFFVAPVDQDYENSATSLSVAWPIGGAARATVGASRFDDEIEQNQSADYLRTTRDGVEAQFDWQAAPSHALAAGARFEREEARSESFGTPLRADTDLLNLFVQDQFERGPHRALAALGYTDHETAGDAVTWNLEYGYAWQGGTLLYGLAGSGFRGPDASDRYGYGGNPGLEPESSRNFELGVRRRFNELHSASLAAFRNDIDDLIEFVTLCFAPGVPDPGCVEFSGENRNVAEARIEGIEATYQYDAAPWSVRVEAVHQDPRDLRTDEVLLRRAKDSLTLSVQRAVGPIDLGLDVLAAGERKDFGFPEPVTLDSYVLANLTARWRLGRALTLTGRIENLLDEQYELADTYNTPDRGLYVTLSYMPGPRGRDARAVAGAYSRSASR
jgi:vitamin B12 transporter